MFHQVQLVDLIKEFEWLKRNRRLAVMRITSIFSVGKYSSAAVTHKPCVKSLARRRSFGPVGEKKMNK